MVAKKYAETPLMKQYYEVKARHPDAILLFRMGDFYETFGEDAIKTAGILGITLTRRANGAASSVELAGFPHHAVETYLPKLVRAGERVAICEQLEDPKTAKGIVKRGVIELVTPGVALSDNILNTKENSFLAAVYFGKRATGVAFLDISTGEFYVGEGSDGYVDKLISNFAPKEVVYQRGERERFETVFGRDLYTYKLDEWVFAEDTNREKLARQLGARSLKGFGVEQLTSAISAAGAILYYLEYTEHKALGHITRIARIDEDRYVWIDRFSIRNLELFASNSTERGAGSFIGVLDSTLTPMGGRLLKHWIALPVKDIDELNSRLDVVEAFTRDPELSDSVAEILAHVGDVERISSRIADGRVLPREIIQLHNSLAAIAQIRELLHNEPALSGLADELDLCTQARDRIAREIYPDPATNQIQKGGIIADGVDMELDDLRRLATHGKEVLATMVEREIARTGITSLKITNNNVFGYAYEVRDTHRDKVPADWTRKQTLKGAERYITPELKEYEEKILSAEGRILAIEQRIYLEIIAFLATHIGAFQRNAVVIARLDVLLSFARVAVARGYNRPVLDEGYVIDIKAGRHPVIERLLPVGEEYVPNDIYLSNDEQQIMMITGPNMSGKSALLRQTALIVLMAQIGSFVPARSAHIGIVDKIFTRVGASDNISQGESTFMVEMTESASILNNISNRSLVLLDEIGRGTSTYDGIAIAWAMVEYLHNHPTARAKTLFATHYHELNALAESCERVRNFHVSVREVAGSVIFLRRLEAGGTERSFGIHVAKIAGMPASVVERADRIMASYSTEGQSGAKAIVPPHTRPKKRGADDFGNVQLSIFQLDDPVLVQIRDQIKGLDIDTLSPLEALNRLSEIKKIAGL
ncbi:MAG: DNA mismatch repair protein MutS [Rikenellaceae bacterium]|jgi:DNA mismatch repair protein MutS|nr:DNA mismatch repair protein MutS [Rikenellaceae bacterium]